MDDRNVLQVTNITHSASDADLADLFSVAGDVARTSIIQSGFPYYAFVEYINPNDARRALNLNGKFFGPSKITVDFATQPFPPQPLLGKAPGEGFNNQYEDQISMNQSNFIRTRREEIPSQITTPRPNRPTVGEGFNNQYEDQNSMNQSNFIRTRREEIPSQVTSPRPNRPTVVQLNKPTNIAPEQVVEVLLTNIPVFIKEHNLHQMFSEFGVVVDSNIVKDASGLTTGRGIVSFVSHESAVRAATAMDGKQLEGSHAPLRCQVKAHSVNPRNTGPVRDLRASLSNNQVRHHPYQNNPNPGPPPQNFNNNPTQMYNQGPPLQQFHQHFDGPKPLNNVGPQSIFDVHGGATHSLTTSPNSPVVQQQPAAVYVGNLPETTCKNCLLYQLFAPYGAISSVRAMEGQKEGKSATWYGFVNYKDITCANVAILTLDKSSLDGQTLKVVIKTDRPGTRGNRGMGRNRFTN